MKPEEVHMVDDLKNIPEEDRYYRCQQCQTVGFDKSLFKIVVFLKVGIVICKECLT